MSLMALTREVSPKIVNCELTHLKRESISFELAQKQHADYCQALRDLGLQVKVLNNGRDFPDGVFVEDPAIVVDEVAVITRMGVPSRRDEGFSLAQALSEFRKLVYIESPGTIEGGDVLRIGKQVFVGLSPRTNESGAEQLKSLLNPYGYEVTITKAIDCLHFKSACSFIGNKTVLINPNWLDRKIFANYSLVEIDSKEPFAANALSIGQTVLFSSAFPLTKAKLEKLGFKLRCIDNSELMKAESALSCMSQIFKV